MSMPRAVRHINEIRVLDTVFRHGSMSRASIARELGLTRSTASSIVAGLVDEGVILEDEAADDRGHRTGRPGTFVRLRAEHALFIGADIGVGRISIVAIDFAANVVAELHEAFDIQNAQPDVLIEMLSALLRSLIGTYTPKYELRGVCVTVPGIIDRNSVVLRAPILGWRNVRLLELISKALPDVAILIAENDANAFAMAELYKAGPLAPQTALYIFLDAGVGGAIVNSGQILRGHDGYAGELGHMILGDEGFVDIATLPGSFESFVGREAVLARYRFHGGSAKDIDTFLEAVIRLEKPALATLSDWSFYLGRALASLASIFNPEKIILGGPVSALYLHCEADVARTLRRNLLPDHPIPQIALSSLGANGPSFGAASILHKAMLTVDENIVFGGGSQD